MATWDEQVDAAINDAVRRMTEGEPPPDFTARVVERIAEAPRDRSWGRAWVLSPLAAAAVVATAVFLFREIADQHAPTSAGNSATAGSRAADPNGSEARPGPQRSGRDEG